MNSSTKSKLQPYIGKSKELNKLCLSITDCPHSTPQWTDSGKIVIRSANIKNGKLSLKKKSYTDLTSFNIRNKRATPESGDLIITREAPMGEVCIIPGGIECCLGQRMVLLKPDTKQISSEYLLYAILSEYVQKQIKKSDATGSTVSNLNIPLIEELKIPLQSSQDYIAAVLSSLDAKIELNNRINAELEAMAKTLYDYWFVQFDFPDENGKPYKSSGGKMVYNETLKREIPEGWEVGQLGDWITFKRGISYKSSDIQETGMPFINLNSFALDGNFKPHGTKYFNGLHNEKSELVAGDLVVAITDVTRNADIIGKAFTIPDIFNQKVLISCDVAAVISDRFESHFLEMLFNSQPYHSYIKHFASGTLVLHLDLNGVEWFKTFLPPKGLMKEFSLLRESIIKKRTINTIENQQLTQLRDWLLPMLMNGQVTVANDLGTCN